MQVLAGDEHLPDLGLACAGGGSTHRLRSLLAGRYWPEVPSTARAVITAERAEPGPSRNSSETATPATQAIRSSATSTGSRRRSERGTPRSVNRSWSDLVPSSPSGLIRSPSRQQRISTSRRAARRRAWPAPGRWARARRRRARRGSPSRRSGRRPGSSGERAREPGARSRPRSARSLSRPPPSGPVRARRCRPRDRRRAAGSRRTGGGRSAPAGHRTRSPRAASARRAAAPGAIVTSSS